MRKLLALLLTLSLFACPALADQLSDIQSKGEIVVATEGAWAPWTYHDETGALVGFDVEVAQAIAELDAEGELSRISIKYFGKDITRPTAE